MKKLANTYVVKSSSVFIAFVVLVVYIISLCFINCIIICALLVINPCEAGSHQCEHVCHYTGAGSYTCSCNKGYKLMEDGYACRGIYLDA